ncbi:MAG TPA: NAD-dependent succinate-semialdehyde dehydrogenase [Saprospiraceae bacterium]|nr:NAD-dependent succinate-semialdehyde dehydrogenase [Saprospiraceae bacterium]
MTIEAINPATEEVLDTYEALDNGQLKGRINKAHQAFRNWKKVPFEERARLMMAVAAELEKNADEYAEIASREMGKTFSSAVAEVKKCAWVCEYYAQEAAVFLSDEMIETDARKSYISYQPLGVVLAVMPWNYPYWQVFRFAAPALMAGNTALLKHASNVPGCAQAIERIFRRAGFPEGSLTNLHIPSDMVKSVIEDRFVRAVTLTGSEKAGSIVASQAGAQIKKTVLELGGSDPYIILDDADLDQAAAICAEGRLKNNGQSCIGAKRFIIVESVYDSFLEKFKSQMSEAVMGDPFDEKTTLGPLARPDLRETLHRQVSKSIEKGAKCIMGGEIPNGPGAYYPATILTDIKPGMPAYEEELFGPVAAVFKVKDEAAAIELANDTDFGLGAAVFTKNLARGERIAKEDIEAGSCFVNDMVNSDPRLPFGGIGISGYGRELSALGIREFVNIKTVSIA